MVAFPPSSRREFSPLIAQRRSRATSTRRLDAKRRERHDAAGCASPASGERASGGKRDIGGSEGERSGGKRRRARRRREEVIDLSGRLPAARVLRRSRRARATAWPLLVCSALSVISCVLFARVTTAAALSRALHTTLIYLYNYIYIYIIARRSK